MECKHCNRLADYIWTDADGNESNPVCTQCMADVPFYWDYPLYHFTPLPGTEDHNESL